MTNNDRIRLLEQFISEEPNDPFNYYALALELSKSEVEKSLTLLKDLIANHPDYVPAYYQVSVLLINKGDTQDVREILSQGMIKAKNQNDQKAFNELRALSEEVE